MDIKSILQRPQGFAYGYTPETAKLQEAAKRLCWEYNQTSPARVDRRREILEELLGDCSPETTILPDFRCDYGFNIHTHGLVFINYNCSILDTSPVEIGESVFIAPGVCIACAGHSIDPEQRGQGIETSEPITIEHDVWIGANATVCGGVTIGAGSVIGAGAVVTHDVPAGVVAAGVPCHVVREINEQDRIPQEGILF